MIVALLIGYNFSIKVISESNERKTKSELQIYTKLLNEKLHHTTINTNNAKQIDKVCKHAAQITNARITIINKKGFVIADTKVSSKSMANHIFRKEISDALDGKSSFTTRHSNTLDQDSLYYASPLRDIEGNIIGVIRLSYTKAYLQAQEKEISAKLLNAMLIILIIGGIIIFYFAMLLNKPIVDIINTIKKISNGNGISASPFESSKEISDISGKLANINSKLQKNINSAKNKLALRDNVLSSINEGIITIDKNDKITMINSACKNILNLNTLNILGTRIYESIRIPEILSSIEQLEKQNAIVEKEFILNIDGKEKIIQFIGRLLKERNNKIGYIISINDVTDVKSFEKLKTEFTANVSHELKTPITAIKGYTETLINGVSKDKETEFLNIILRQTNRLNTLINDILTLSKLEQMPPDITEDFEDKNINTLIEYVIENHQKLADDKNITIEFTNNNPIDININVSLIEQALNNLLINAIQYANSYIKIDTAIIDEMLNISIYNDGPAIAKEHQEKIFNRFYRIDRHRSRSLGGTGLGLAIVKYVTKIHKGTVSLKSEAQQGCEFTISIPVRKS